MPLVKLGSKKRTIYRMCTAQLPACIANAFRLARLAACWPNRILTRHRRAAKGAGLFDGSVHGALTALKLGLVDDVVEETFPEAMKQRYGRRIFLKRLTPGRDLRLLVRPPAGPTQWK